MCLFGGGVVIEDFSLALAQFIQMCLSDQYWFLLGGLYEMLHVAHLICFVKHLEDCVSCTGSIFITCILSAFMAV